MISATIITLNEEKNILKALESIKDFVDEIIIVDSGSSDKTIEIAKKFNVKIFNRKFDNFANQKNWAVSKTTGDWILALDADEEITEDLKKEIKEKINDSNFTAFIMPRKNFILGKEIKYSRWSPDKHIWLWKKGFGKWVGNVHEEVQVMGEIGVLKNNKIHNSHRTLSEFMKANDFYSSILATDLFSKKEKFSFSKMIWESIYEFVLRFILKLGFLDGLVGFILAYTMGIYKLTVWVKVWELEKQKQ